MLNVRNFIGRIGSGLVCGLMLAGCTPSPAPSLLSELDALTTDAAVRLFDGNTPSGKLTALIGSLAIELQSGGSPVMVEALTAFMYDSLGIGPLTDVSPAESFLITRMVNGKTGSCVGLTGLYLLLAEKLNIPLQARLLPGHITVCHTGGDTAVNYETLRSGLVRSDAFYRDYYSPVDGPDNLMPLSPAQFAAVYAYNIGNAYRERGLLHDAVRMYRYAADRFPAYAPAVENLRQGLTLIGE